MMNTVKFQTKPFIADRVSNIDLKFLYIFGIQWLIKIQWNGSKNIILYISKFIWTIFGTKILCLIQVL